MNMFNMMQAMQNPQAYAMQQMMGTMIQQNPQQWQQAQQMFQGKTKKQMLSELQKMYKDRGMDLQQTAAQYGISL